MIGIKGDEQVWSLSCFEKKTWSWTTNKVDINEVFAQELHKPVIKRFKKKSILKI